MLSEGHTNTKWSRKPKRAPSHLLLFRTPFLSLCLSLSFSLFMSQSSLAAFCRKSILTCGHKGCQIQCNLLLRTTVKPREVSCRNNTLSTIPQHTSDGKRYSSVYKVWVENEAETFLEKKKEGGGGVKKASRWEHWGCWRYRIQERVRGTKEAKSLRVATKGQWRGRKRWDRRGERSFRVAVKATEAPQEFGNQWTLL